MGQREAQAANSIPVDGDAARFFVKNAQRSSSQVIPNNSKDSENKAEMRSSAARSSSGGCPVVGPNQIAESRGGCPVVGVNPGNQMPPSANAPAFPGQAKPLNRNRQSSSIPTAKRDDNEPETWMYPSEQMFYNAMKRKGWDPSEEDMPAVVAIHNAVNERAWREIQKWEARQGISDACGGPKLVRFRGRPKDVSPKARLLNLMGYKLPFDRHDWIVDRCGQEVRYIIDFYNAAPMPNMPAALHLDVRPALDSPSLLWERLSMQFKWMLSGRWRE